MNPSLAFRPRRLAGCFALVLFLLGAPSAAQQSVVVDLLSGPPLRGELISIAPSGLELRVAGEERRLAVDDLVGIAFDSTPLPRQESLANILLVNGGQLRAVVVGGAEEILKVRFGARAELQLPYGSYVRLEIPSRAGTRSLEAPGADGLDRVYRQVGEALDLLDGIVIGYDDLGVTLEDEEGREAFVAWKELAALFFSSSEEEEALPPTRLVVRLRDGSQAEGALRPPGAGSMVLAVRPDSELEFLYDEIAAVEVVSPRFARLSGLEPVAIEVRPFFEDGPAPHHVEDRSLLSDSLRVGGETFSRGIALRPICDLSYALEGAYTSFRVRVGIDDAVEPERHLDQSWFGTVGFHIEVDGKNVWSSGVVRAGAKAFQAPTIDLGGARRLTLRTDFADGFPAGDFPIWLDPILIR